MVNKARGTGARASQKAKKAKSKETKARDTYVKQQMAKGSAFGGSNLTPSQRASAHKRAIQAGGSGDYMRSSKPRTPKKSSKPSPRGRNKK